MIAQMFNKSLWANITDSNILKSTFDKLLLNSNFQILGFIDYSFNPFGYTALWLLGESHFAIHTFPEENKTYIELSSCVKDKYDNFIKLLSEDDINKYFEN